MYDVTNAEVDTAAAALSSGNGGPLTRVSDVENYPMPNSEMDIEFTTSDGFTVFMSYAQLLINSVALRKVTEARGISGRVAAIKATVNTLDTTMDGYSAPHTYPEYQATIGTLRTIRATEKF